MTRILLRAHKDPFRVVSPKTTYRRNLIGENVGNLLFSSASYKLLQTEGTEIEVGHLKGGKAEAARINAQADHVVIPLANAFRPSYAESLDRMSETIEALRVPVTILGVGAQLRLDGKVERLDAMKESVTRFVRAVLDRSPSIGVRGEFTERYLKGLGFSDVEVVGCPSVFLNGPGHRVEKRVAALTEQSRISLNLSPYVPGLGPIVEGNMERYPNLRYAAQHRDALGMLLSRQAPQQDAHDGPVGPPDAPRAPARARRPHELLRRPGAVDALPRGLRLQLRHPDPRQHRRAARRHARDGARARLPHARARPLLRHPAPHDEAGRAGHRRRGAVRGGGLQRLQRAVSASGSTASPTSSDRTACTTSTSRVRTRRGSTAGSRPSAGRATSGGRRRCASSPTALVTTSSHPAGARAPRRRLSRVSRPGGPTGRSTRAATSPTTVQREQHERGRAEVPGAVLLRGGEPLRQEHGPHALGDPLHGEEAGHVLQPRRQRREGEVDAGHELQHQQDRHDHGARRAAGAGDAGDADPEHGRHQDRQQEQPDEAEPVRRVARQRHPEHRCAPPRAGAAAGSAR